jgi:hypothetical protein
MTGYLSPCSRLKPQTGNVTLITWQSSTEMTSHIPLCPHLGASLEALWLEPWTRWQIPSHSLTILWIYLLCDFRQLQISVPLFHNSSIAGWYKTCCTRRRNVWFSEHLPSLSRRIQNTFISMKINMYCVHPAILELWNNGTDIWSWRKSHNK